MKNFKEFRTNKAESVEEGTARTFNQKGSADYYMTDNESQVSFSVPFGTLLVSLNTARADAFRTDRVTAKEMKRIQGLMFKLYKGKDKEAGITMETKVTQMVSYGNIRIGKQLEKAEQQFVKQLHSIISKEDAKIAKQLSTIK